MQKKDIIYIFIILVLIVVGALLFLQYTNQDTVIEIEETAAPIPVEPDGGIGDGAVPLEELEEIAPVETIGNSVDGNNIDVYRFGEGERDILLVAGVHGGYAWNTSELAYELIEYYEDIILPEEVTLHIVPALNPDGLLESLGTVENILPAEARQLSDAERVAGRFNGNNVDLNRNFDCAWEAEGTWRNQTVSGGSAAFSEPEAVALRDYVNRIDPVAAVVWFAAEGKVYPSACEGEPSRSSIALAETFANSAEYDVDPVFDAYAITGDMVNWMSGQSIPAISVLLSNFTSTEFEQNREAVDAVITTYGQ